VILFNSYFTGDEIDDLVTDTPGRLDSGRSVIGIESGHLDMLATGFLITLGVKSRSFLTSCISTEMPAAEEISYMFLSISLECSVV
jgi:hypothetical protein